LIETLTTGQPSGAAHSFAVKAAQKVLAQNRIGASQLSPGNHCQNDGPPVELGKYQLCLESGKFNFSSYEFQAFTEPYNAVRAEVTAKVPNIVAGIWPGNETSTVTKVAIAGLQSIQSGPVDLPLMIGDCLVPDPIHCGEEAQKLHDFPNENEDTGWTNWNPNTDHLKIVDFKTGFTEDVEANRILANTDSADDNVDVVSFWLPHEWCPDHYPLKGKANACGGGGGGGPDDVEVGDKYQFIDKTGDQFTYMLADGIVNHGVDTFRVPLMECGKGPTKEPATVTGFATIRIDLTVEDIESGAYNKKEWDITWVCDAEATGPPGGVTSGTGFVTLLR
jgi:hypothetical protein